MILEAIVNLLVNLVSAVGDMFGTLTLPSWWTQIDGWLSTLGAAAAGFGDWVPISTALTVTGFVVLSVVAALGIRVTRMLVSLFTGGGGSAA